MALSRASKGIVILKVCKPFLKTTGFPSQGVLRQIRNAMPPLFAKILVMAIIAAWKDSERFLPG